MAEEDSFNFLLKLELQDISINWFSFIVVKPLISVISVLKLSLPSNMYFCLKLKNIFKT